MRNQPLNQQTPLRGSFCYNKNSTLTSPPSRNDDRMKEKIDNSEFSNANHNEVDTWLEDIRDYDNPLIGVNVYSFDALLGKLFTTFELLGLPERQGSALKGSVRKMAWEWYDKHLPNPSGLASPSLQARRAANINVKDIM